jgi:hypothetical protein
MKVKPNSDKEVGNKEAQDRSNRELKTPKTLKLIRRFQKHFANNPTKEL